MGTLVGLAAVGLAGAFWHRHQMRNLGERFAAAAEEAEAQQAWRRALTAWEAAARLQALDGPRLARLAAVLERLARDPADLRRAREIYAQALALDPRQAAARAALARLQLAESPRAALDTLATGSDLAGSPELLRLRATALARLVAEGDREVALADLDVAYSAAHAAEPGHLGTVVGWAMFLRERGAELATEIAQPADKLTAAADRLLDQVVAAAPDKAEAHLARFAYRRRFHPESLAAAPGELDSDLAAALAAAPDDAEAHLAAAQWLLPTVFARPLLEPPAAGTESRELLREVERHLLAAQRAAPHDPRPYLALAELGWRAGDAAGARQVLTAATERLALRHPRLWLTRAELELSAGAWAEVDAALAEFRRLLDRTPSELLGGEERRELVAAGRLVQARRAVRGWEPRTTDPQAKTALWQTRDLLEESVATSSRELAHKLQLELVACYEALGQNRAAEAARRKADRLAAGEVVEPGR